MTPIDFASRDRFVACFAPCGLGDDFIFNPFATSSDLRISTDAAGAQARSNLQCLSPCAPPSTVENRVTPSVCVVICTRDRPEHLNRCLESVSRLNYPNFDILVVDNAPSDARALDVARRWNARYVLERSPGLSRARNRGARECSSDFIAYIDDDAVAEAGWLSALAPEFADPLVMAVAGAILPFGAEKSVVAAELHPETSIRRPVDRGTPHWFEIANLGGIGIGANMAFRRAVFGLWPGFDVRLGRGQVLRAGEDDYAFFTLIDRGFRVARAPHAMVYHDTLPTPSVEAAAYLTFLWFEQPRYRREMLKTMVRSLRSASYPWRSESDWPQFQTQSRMRKIMAIVTGSVLYARSRLHLLQAGRTGANHKFGNFEN